jgi:hypothetical protein
MAEKSITNGGNWILDVMQVGHGMLQPIDKDRKSQKAEVPDLDKQ